MSPQALSPLERGDMFAAGMVSGSDPALFTTIGEIVSALTPLESWVVSSSDGCLGH